MEDEAQGGTVDKAQMFDVVQLVQALGEFPLWHLTTVVSNGSACSITVGPTKQKLAVIDMLALAL